MTSTCPNDQHHQGDDQQEDDQHHQGDDQHLPDQQQHHQDHPVGWLPEPCKNRNPCCLSPIVQDALRIDDLGLGELPVDSTQDRALAGLL